MQTTLTACMASLNRGAETVWPAMAQLLANHPSATMSGFTVEVVPSIDSTNAELMRRARAGSGYGAPTLLVAANQTAGRGRMGKTWLSQPGHSLTFSIALPLQPAHWAGLSLATGVSLAESLSGLLSPPVGNALQLKWPNDLWLRGGKLGGILVEAAHHAGGASVVVGAGINLVAPVPDPAQTWSGVPPTGLASHLQGVDVGSVLCAVAPPLLRDLLAFEALGFPAFAQRFALRDALRDQTLVLTQGQNLTVQGTGCGVDEDGALLVLTPDGVQTVHSAEVSVRPLARSA